MRYGTTAKCQTTSRTPLYARASLDPGTACVCITCMYCALHDTRNPPSYPPTSRRRHIVAPFIAVHCASAHVCECVFAESRAHHANDGAGEWVSECVVNGKHMMYASRVCTPPTPTHHTQPLLPLPSYTMLAHSAHKSMLLI